MLNFPTYTKEPSQQKYIQEYVYMTFIYLASVVNVTIEADGYWELRTVGVYFHLCFSGLFQKTWPNRLKTTNDPTF